MAEYNQATYDAVADIIAEVSSIDRATIMPDSHAINDLGIDSLDFLDVTFAIDKKFGIKMPIERWTQEVNEGKAPAEQMVMKMRVDAKRTGACTPEQLATAKQEENAP